MTVSRTGTTATPFGFGARSEYQTDFDSGLMLLGHRYYDPSIGRFITKDPAKDGRNWYALGARYRAGGKAAWILFRPANELDRLIRPDYWILMHAYDE